MAGRLFANWWAKMSPYYSKAYQEMWVGIGVMTYLYYKVSYGGENKIHNTTFLPGQSFITLRYELSNVQRLDIINILKEHNCD